MFANFKLPHAALVAFSGLAVVVTWLTAQETSGAVNLPAWGVTALSLVTMLLGLFSPSASPSAAAAAKSAAKFAGVLAVLALTGCLASAPIVPVTSANSAQITSCQSSAAVHNDFVVAGFALGGISAGLGSAGAVVSDQTAKTDLAISAAVVGGLMLVDSAVTGFSASNFANSNCTQVVGALPSSPLGSAPPPPAVPAGQ